MKRKWSPRVVAGVVLILAGVLVASYPFATDLRYAMAQRGLAGSMTGAASNGQQMPGSTVARLVVPRIGLDAYVLEGTTRAVLDQAPGHYEGTPLPGDSGNCCIAGHRTMYGHPFRRLDELRQGDEIVAYTPKRQTRYAVVSVTTVAPTDVEVAAATADDRLTLTTCNPVGSAAQRLVVVAEPSR